MLIGIIVQKGNMKQQFLLLNPEYILDEYAHRVNNL